LADDGRSTSLATFNFKLIVCIFLTHFSGTYESRMSNLKVLTNDVLTAGRLTKGMAMIPHFEKLGSSDWPRDIRR
jgi:hypothetical protein